MQILLTGGAGFIGSHVAERLLEQGSRVRVLDDLSTGSLANLPPGIQLHQVALLGSDLAELCQGCEVVIHAAAQTSVAFSTQEPVADAMGNIIGTLRLLEAAISAGVRRFVYLSSAAVYGEPASLPITESQIPAPTSAYGLSKWVGERYVRLLAEASGMDWVILRLANVYGPRQSSRGEAGVIARWSAALAAGEPIHLFGDGGQARDFIYVADVADAVTRASSEGRAGGRVLQISTGQALQLRKLLSTLEALLGQSATLKQGPARPGDIYQSVLDPTAARDCLGWVASTPLDEGLASTLAWANQHVKRG